MNNIKEYKNQIVLFIDLLGFKQAVDENKQESILNLLLSFASMKNEFNINIERHENGVSYSMIPEISVFSDNLVLSIPLDDLEDKFPENNMLDIMRNISIWVSYIAAISLESGFLVRGGISYGKLFHKNGVIFGDALIDAYKLESKVAIYPRVLISKSVSKCRTEKRCNSLAHSLHVKTDFDGLQILNYISSKGSNILYSPLRNNTMPARDINEDHLDLFVKTNKKIEKFDEIITKNKSMAENKLDILKKWLYFEKEYDILKAREQELQARILSYKETLSSA